LVVGTALFLAGLLASSLPVFVVALVVSGAGFGGGFLGSLRAVTQLAAPHERAALLSAVYVVSYLAFSIPAVVAGVFVTHDGLRDTTAVYGAVILALALLAAATRVPRRRASA
ncbi:MAG: MFS transporter, partial [Jatrophihabitans endophyticus]|nr:MFS transporter [Jatrophihabitans endophyticus]